MTKPDPNGCRTAILRGTLTGAELRERYIDAPRFLGCCQQCPDFGRWWSCPPYDFDPMTVWAAYDRLELLAMQIFPESESASEKALKDPHGLLAPYRTAVDAALERMEAAAPGSLRLNAGKCILCRSCAREEGRPCRRRGEMRYSIESLGGNVGALAAEVLGAPLQWGAPGEPPAYFLLVGGLLTKEKDHA